MLEPRRLLAGNLQRIPVWDGEASFPEGRLLNLFGGPVILQGADLDVQHETTTVSAGRGGFRLVANIPANTQSDIGIALGGFGPSDDYNRTTTRDLGLYTELQFDIKNDSGEPFTMEFVLEDADGRSASRAVDDADQTDFHTESIPLDLNDSDWSFGPSGMPDLGKMRNIVWRMQAGDQAVAGNVFIDELIVLGGPAQDPALLETTEILDTLLERHFKALWALRHPQTSLMPTNSAFADEMALNATAGLIKLLPLALEQNWITEQQADATVQNLLTAMNQVMDSATFLPFRLLDRVTLEARGNPREESIVDAALLYLALYQYQQRPGISAQLDGDIQSLLDRFRFSNFRTDEGWRLAYLIDSRDFTPGKYDGYSTEVFIISLAAHLARDGADIETMFHTGTKRVKASLTEPTPTHIVHQNDDARAPFSHWLLDLFVDTSHRGNTTFPDITLRTNPHENAVVYQKEVHAALAAAGRGTLLQPDAADDGSGGFYRAFSLYNLMGRDNLFMPWSLAFSLLADSTAGDAALRTMIDKGLYGPFGLVDSARWNTGEADPETFNGRFDLWNSMLWMLAVAQFRFGDNGRLASDDGVNEALDRVFERTGTGSPIRLDAASLLPENGGDGSEGFTFRGDTDAAAGSNIGSGGDFNHDGFDELAIGAPLTSNARGVTGEAYLVWGDPASPPARLTPQDLNGDGLRIPGVAASDRTSPVANLWDINGDGIDDFAVAAYQADTPGGLDAGKVYVIFGTDQPPASPLDLTTLDGSNGFTVTGFGERAHTGTSISTAGDTNADGLHDFLIGVPRANDSQGAAYLLFGTDNGFPAELDLSQLAPGEGLRFPGLAAGDQLGRRVTGGVDLNGDGLDDVAFSAYSADPGGRANAGSTFVVFGNDSAPATVDVDLATLDGSNGYRIDGAAAGHRAGSGLSVLGDVNGDGLGDLGLGARGASPSNRLAAGQTYVILGSDTVTGAILDLATLTPAQGFSIHGKAQADASGTAVGGPGDVNADGYDEVLVGAPFAGPADEGELALVYGGPSPADVDLNLLDGTSGFTIQGVDANDFLGIAFSGGFDFNGDGYREVYGSSRQAADTRGEGYVFFGDDFRQQVTHAGSADDDALEGSDGDDIINGEVGDDEIHGRLGTDVLYGAQGDDWISVATTAFMRIDGGRGFDTLELDASGLTLDLTALPTLQLASIEQVDARGSGSNEVVLDQRSVLRISESTNTLILHTNPDDNLVLQGDWTLVGGEYRDGVLYHRLEDGNAVLLWNNETPWQNPLLPPDVNLSGAVEPIDVLIIVNRINARAGDPSLPPEPAVPAPYLDPSGDNLVTALDALIPINFLNGLGEGEAAGSRFGAFDSEQIVLLAASFAEHGGPEWTPVAEPAGASLSPDGRPRDASVEEASVLHDASSAILPRAILTPRIDPRDWADALDVGLDEWLEDTGLLEDLGDLPISDVLRLRVLRP